MSCFDEGSLRAYLDRELSGKEHWEVEAHLAGCERCREALNRVSVDAASIERSLSILADESKKIEVDTDEAWRRVGVEIDQARTGRVTGGLLANPVFKKYVVVAAVAAVALGSLSFAPVRSFASGLLEVFRVNKIETIDVSLSDLEKIRVAFEQNGQVDLENFGTITTQRELSTRPVTLEEAQAKVDFKLKLPTGLGDPKLELSSPSSFGFALKVDKVNSLLKGLGGTKMFPADADGKEFKLVTPVTLTAGYASTGKMPVVVTESKSPEFIAPEGVDIDAIREAMLDLPALPDNVRSQLKAVKDWRSTLIIPNFEGSTRKVTVNGYDGVFISQPAKTISPGEPRGDGGRDGPIAVNNLVWHDGLVVYAVSGDLTLDEALEIAASMR